MIGGKTTGRLAAGQLATLTVPLTEKGLAHYFCAERLHDEFYHEYGDFSSASDPSGTLRKSAYRPTS